MRGQTTQKPLKINFSFDKRIHFIIQIKLTKHINYVKSTFSNLMHFPHFKCVYTQSDKITWNITQQQPSNNSGENK